MFFVTYLEAKSGTEFVDDGSSRYLKTSDYAFYLDSDPIVDKKPILWGLPLPTHSLSSEAEEKGSMFCLTDPLKRKGVWEITEMCCRRECSPISSALKSPIEYFESSSGSTIRNMVWMIDDFPAPVRPTIATFWPGSTLKYIFY